MACRKASSINPPPPPGCEACQIRIGIRQFQAQMPSAHSARPPHNLPGPDPKASKSRFFEGPFFGPFFGPPFSGLGRFSERTKTSQSPPLALLGGVLGRLRLAVSAENSIIPCIESTCASGVFWASGASPGSQQVPVLNPRAPFLGPKGPQVKKKGSQNGPLFQQKSLISRKI